MRLLLDENVPGSAVESLRSDGHDVLWVRTDCPGISDEEILARAASQNRLLITMDKDFGELAFRAVLPAGTGIVLVRVVRRSASELGRAIAEGLSSRTDWAGHFSVIDENQIRMKPLPARPLPRG